MQRLGRIGIALFFFVFLAACTGLQRPVAEPFVTVTAPPPKQELRWSNGKLPKSFDPAMAAAAPETDVARAIYEGLTEIDPQTLEAKPALAETWTSDDQRVWTFNLRTDARWSNGKRVTAGDVAASWKRLRRLGGQAAHPQLTQNIVGFKKQQPVETETTLREFDEVIQDQTEGPVDGLGSFPQDPQSSQSPTAQQPIPPDSPLPKTVEDKIGVEAIDDSTLKVTLELPDKDFPKLVADPMFFPVHGDAKEFDTDPLPASVITNGAFKVTLVGKDAIYLERSSTYWNKNAVKLERARLIATENSEAALGAYKKGDIDVITNAMFQPLALKLLTPYEDFRRTRHSALNLYEINAANAPFSDRRVREALAISIDRERLVEKELQGVGEPALNLIPVGSGEIKPFVYDVRAARELLERSGYPNGEGFPSIRLVVNRNDTQTRIARTVARMWKQELNLDTTIIVKESSEMDAVRQAGDYDVVRRGVVLPTVDQMASLSSIFGPRMRATQEAVEHAEPSPEPGPDHRGPSDVAAEELSPELSDQPDTPLVTEADAIYEAGVIPLYFPLSYSLVKPYVHGFEVNGLGAPPLKYVAIDNAWQPPRRGSE